MKIYQIVWRKTTRHNWIVLSHTDKKDTRFISVLYSVIRDIPTTAQLGMITSDSIDDILPDYRSNYPVKILDHYSYDTCLAIVKFLENGFIGLNPPLMAALVQLGLLEK